MNKTMFKIHIHPFEGQDFSSAAPGGESSYDYGLKMWIACIDKSNALLTREISQAPVIHLQVFAFPYILQNIITDHTPVARFCEHVFQNIKFPVYRGRRVSLDEIVRLQLLESLSCYLVECHVSEV